MSPRRRRAGLTGGVETLPPAGDERREVLRERADNLAERAEIEGAEGGRINPRALRVENELAQHFNLLEVSAMDPAYRYAWVALGQHGLFIKMKLAEGWEVVQGDMPEASELRGMGADTTRKLGDVMLMRIQLDRWIRSERRRKAARDAQSEGVTGRLTELNDSLDRNPRTHGAKVHTDLSTLDPRTAKMAMDRAAAQSQAATFVDRHLRSDTMPGVPAAAGR